MKRILLKIYKYVFLRKRFYKYNKFIYELALNGIGVLNYQNSKISGEQWFVKKWAKQTFSLVVLDVGANVGEYSSQIKQENDNVKIYAFEPHPKTFKQLELKANKFGFIANNVAVGEKSETLTLFDYADNDGSQHASLYRAVIEDVHYSASTGVAVEVVRLDDYVEMQGIERVGLLKIDTEGHEISVLRGASKCIQKGLIEVIHFEFNEMNVISRVFMKDFFEILHAYHFYRLLPDGMVNIDRYNALGCEIFAYQNIVAIHHLSNLNDTL